MVQGSFVAGRRRRRRRRRGRRREERVVGRLLAEWPCAAYSSL
jgi:hypothetical protein